MKKIYLLIVLAIISGMAVSCKNRTKENNAEANTEVVEAAKIILADDVMATIDGLSGDFIKSCGNSDISAIFTSALTEEEKLARPDYFMAPSKANEWLTNNQKIYGLSYLVIDLQFYHAYGLPTEDVEAAIAKLVADLNFPISIDDMKNKTLSEKVRAVYNDVKEKGEIEIFWKFAVGTMTEFEYIISQNPDPFFRNVTSEQLANVYHRYSDCVKAIKELANYDEEIATAYNTISENALTLFNADFTDVNSLKSAMSSKEWKDATAAHREALLK